MLLLLGAAAPAQQGSQIATLAQAAAQASNNWENLAKSLDAKIARMLPCDPRLTAAIEEASQASQGRLAALNLYLQAAIAQARQDSESAAAALAAEQGAAHELETDRAEGAQELVAVNGQLSDLTESARHRTALESSRAALQIIAETVAARVAAIQVQQTHRAALVSALNAVVETTQSGQHALEMRLSALVLETSRWGDYYAARLARAHTECDITNPAAARRKR